MIANLEPGKVVTLDREFQERNTTLMLMLYGAVAKYGIGMKPDSTVLVSAQVPVLQVPANHSLQWEVSENGKSVMLYIVLNEDSLAESNPTNITTTPAPVSDDFTDDEFEVTLEKGIGDEFEDEIKVGMDESLRLGNDNGN